MRRILAATASTALVVSSLAFAPAVQQATTHTVTFTADGTQTVQGGAPGGVNLTPFIPNVEQSCDGTAAGYCETVLLEVVQPVQDLDDGVVEFGSGSVYAELSPELGTSDFDLYVYDSDADGTRGAAVTADGEDVFSAGFPVIDDCGASMGSECIQLFPSTHELSSTSYYLIEVYYFASAAAYSMDITYERTDGRNAEGGYGELAGDPNAPADSVERFDVSFYGDIPTEAGGDWNGGQNSEVGSALGQDFEGAFLEYKDDTFFFVLDMTELPAIGGTPEATRYSWSFAYVSGDDRIELELDGKFTNYTRGACDPTAGTCPPPRDPGMSPFLVRGNCYADTTLPITMNFCEELANVQASFDVADGTITVPVPAASLAPGGVEACDRIEGRESLFGESVYAAPSAYFTLSSMPFDSVAHYTPLVVPHADASLSCDA